MAFVFPGGDFKDFPKNSGPGDHVNCKCKKAENTKWQSACLCIYSVAAAMYFKAKEPGGSFLKGLDDVIRGTT